MMLRNASDVNCTGRHNDKRPRRQKPQAFVVWVFSRLGLLSCLQIVHTLEESRDGIKKKTIWVLLILGYLLPAEISQFTRNLKQKQNLPQCCVLDYIRFSISPSKGSIQTNIKKSRYPEHNKSKTVTAINLKQRLKVSHIL